MTDQVFYSVWFLPEENKWSNMNPLAFRDVGKLTISTDAITFQTKQNSVSIQKIKHVSMGKQGRDFVNNWVRVDFGDPPQVLQAFFADGSWLGYGGIFGGTKKIYNAVMEVYQRGV
jgi:hypothetical protein